MKLYSSHFHPPDSPRAGAPPVLVREGIAWRCIVLGWLGLLFGAWMPALLVGAVSLPALALTRHLPGHWVMLAGINVLVAFFANDLRRWDLRLRGFTVGPLVAGRDAGEALLRLLDHRPELLGGGT